MDAPVIQRVFWCILVALVAIVLLLGGGIASLQALAISFLDPNLYPNGIARVTFTVVPEPAVAGLLLTAAAVAVARRRRA